MSVSTLNARLRVTLFYPTGIKTRMAGYGVAVGAQAAGTPSVPDTTAATAARPQPATLASRCPPHSCSLAGPGVHGARRGGRPMRVRFSLSERFRLPVHQYYKDSLGISPCLGLPPGQSSALATGQISDPKSVLLKEDFTLPLGPFLRLYVLGECTYSF